MEHLKRRSLYANEATLIEYEIDSGLLWWDSIPIGRLIDSPLAIRSVEEHVNRLHEADVYAQATRMAKLNAAARLRAENS